MAIADQKSATHSESKAENKYDTLGLEAAYLAHGLSMKAHELQLLDAQSWILDLTQENQRLRAQLPESNVRYLPDPPKR